MPCRDHLLARGLLVSAGLTAMGLLATASPVHATTLRKMDLSELVVAADRIVDARAISSTVYWDPTETQIYTDTTFEVIDEAKGSGPTTVTVTLLGGTIGEVELRSEGAPIVALGDE